MRNVLAALMAVGAAASAQECPPFDGDPSTARAVARQWDEEAQVRLRQRDFAGAAARYRRITCLFPETAAAWLGWGVAEAAGGNPSIAETKLERARELAPRDERVLLALAQARAASGKFPEARAALNEAATVAPNNPRTALLLVQVLIAGKSHDDLIKEALRGAAQRRPADTRLHSQLAQLLFEQKRYDWALAELLRVKSSGQLEPELALRLATLENLAGAHEDAVADAANLENGRADERTRAAAAGIGGLSLDRLGRNAEAIAALRRSVTLNPASEPGWIALVDIFEKTQNVVEAAAAAAEGLAAIPGSSELARRVALNLLNAGRPEEAAAVLVRQVASAPEQPTSWALLVRAYLATAEGSKAIDALERLRQLDPAYPMLYVMSAQARLRLDPPAAARALEDLALAEKAAPDDPEVFVSRAQAFLHLRRPMEAIAALRRALELRPEDPSLHYQLGQLYRKQGQAELAEQEFERTRFLRSGQP